MSVSPSPFWRAPTWVGIYRAWNNTSTINKRVSLNYCRTCDRHDMLLLYVWQGSIYSFDHHLLYYHAVRIHEIRVKPQILTRKSKRTFVKFNRSSHFIDRCTLVSQYLFCKRQTITGTWRRYYSIYKDICIQTVTQHRIILIEQRSRIQ